MSCTCISNAHGINICKECSDRVYKHVIDVKSGEFILMNPGEHATPMKEEKCENCRFFYLFSDEISPVCRRLPPVFRPSDSQTRFAEVEKNWWCGEHKHV